MSIEQNKEAVHKFIDALNQQDLARLAEVSTPEVVQEWTEAMPGLYSAMNEHHIDVAAIVAEGDLVAVKMATSGYHSGDIFGIPATGKKWTNRVYTFFRLVDGKIAEVDALPDAENHIKQLGGVITTANPS
jgi:predicted ester cyclase